MNDGWEVFVIVVLLIVVFALVILGPIFTIWSLNTLFGLGIPYTFKTWCATIWIHTILHGIRTSFKRSGNQQTTQ